MVLGYCLTYAAWAADIAVTGSWSETIDVNDLQAGPGSDLTDTYSSAVDAIQIDISNTAVNWRVDIKKVDVTWDTGFTLSARRNSAGSGPGSVSGGTSYQTITDTDTSFFTGNSVTSGIDVQLQLSGVSIQIPPNNNYRTSIYYTIVETG